MYKYILAVTVSLALSTTILSAAEFKVATWNLEWFNDHETSDDSSNIGPNQAAPDESEYEARVAAIAASIANMAPEIIGLQEVENQKVVTDLADQLTIAHGAAYQVSFVQGRDTYTGQDVAYLIKDGIEFKGSRFDFTEFADDADFKDLSKHQRLQVTIDGQDIEIINVHLITRLAKRVKQANTLRAWIEELMGIEHIIVLGDFNTKQAYAQTTENSEMGKIRGFETADTSDDLQDAHRVLVNRATHTGGSELDRILYSDTHQTEDPLQLVSMVNHRDLAIVGLPDNERGVSYHLPASKQDLSDHFPLVATFTFDQTVTAALSNSSLSNTDMLSRISDIENQMLMLTNQLSELKSELQ